MRALLPLLLALAPLQAAEELPPRAQVIRVYDGDTFTLETGDPVRLRWVNTTELRPPEEFSEEARDATTAFVQGKVVDLSYADPPRDAYGRLVADVHVGGVSLEIHLLEEGLAHIMLIPPVDADLEPLFQAQARARDLRKGLWSTDRFKGPFHITSFHANGKGDDRANPNAEYLRICNITDGPVDLDGFRFTNARGRSYQLPPVVVPAGHTVKVHTGIGEHQTDPREQLAVYLGSAAPIWNNSADEATLLDREGNTVDHRVHRVKSR